MTRRYNRTCEECGEPHTYCVEDVDGIMICKECQQTSNHKQPQLNGQEARELFLNMFSVAD